MNVICVICSDLLAQSNEVFYTRCGHVFHYECLTQWLERSKTCPQCREKVTQNKIHRLYFTFSSNDIVDDSSASLQERIDSLKFQILLKEKDIKYYTSKNVTLEKQNAGLRQEVRKVESEINQKNSAIYALKEQTKYFKEQSLECDNLKKEVTTLKKKIEELRDIQILLNAPSRDVDEMIGKARDPTTLITYISVMKKELLANLGKRKQLRITVKKFQNELTKVAMERDSLLGEQSRKMELEERLAISESEKISLQLRVDELEEMLGITKELNNSDSVMQQIKHEGEVSKENFAEQSLLIRTNTTRKSYKNPTSSIENKEKDTNSSQQSCKRSIKENSKSPSHQQLGINQCTSSEDSIVNCTPTNDFIPSKKPRLSRVHKQNNEISDVAAHDEYMAVSMKHKKTRETTAKTKKEKSSRTSKNKTDESIIDLT